jgi:hypothetical protein
VQEQGKASGVSTVLREVGGVLGVAILATVFAAHGSTRSAAAFLAGTRPAFALGAAAAAAGTLAAACLPRARQAPAPELAALPATD